MSDPESRRTAAALRVSIGLLLRRLRQVHGRRRAHAARELRARPPRPRRSGDRRARWPGRSRSARSRWARRSARSRRAASSSAQPRPGRRPPRRVSLTDAGPRRRCDDRRNARIEQIARALSTGFTPEELRAAAAAAPLLERLAQTSDGARTGGTGGPGDAPSDRYKWMALSNTTLAVFMSAARRVDRHHRPARHLPRHPPRPARRRATSATCCG